MRRDPEPVKAASALGGVTDNTQPPLASTWTAATPRSRTAPWPPILGLAQTWPGTGSSPCSDEVGWGWCTSPRTSRLKRKVALKLLSPELAQDATFRDRFVRESEMAASLDHPNIVPIYEADERDGVLFIAMRYVEGPSLKEALDEGPLEPTKTVSVIEQVARALDAAHARGLIHRDVKPGNVLLAAEPEGHAYLTDFGLT
jgi:serine/threonine protein kinase